MYNPFRKVLKSCQRFHFLAFITILTSYAYSQVNGVLDPQFDKETEKCLNCHSAARYDLTDPETGETVNLKMYDELRIDPHLYITAAHGGFSCTDCHSPDYETHPHPLHVKFDFQYSCLDCHGYDDTYAQFHFETIEEEFDASVHSDRYIENFSCWSCHNPHTYRVTARERGRVIDIVAYNNSMCLNCHGDISHYAVLIEKQLTNMLSKHEWLPNQSLHFRKVRCIDCHAAVHEDILVAHHVLPADQAVRNCVDCHSTNSILLASLYKYQVVERRNKYGFFNAEVTSDAYIIGANRNYFFNIASIVIFGLVILAIAIHATLRYIHYRRKQ
jgi:hypothetical protein